MQAAAKLSGVAVVVASTLTVSVVGASAKPPTRYPYDVAGTYTTVNACDFPVDVSFHAVGVSTIFGGLEEDGTGRASGRATQQNTYTANGNTLVGDPYRGTSTLKFVDGELVSYTYVGVLEKVRLPDGSTFIAAGRTDLLLTEVDWVAVPTHGVSKNQDAFCAALSA